MNNQVPVTELLIQSIAYNFDTYFQGNLKHWKIVLTNEEFSTGYPKYTYEAKFEVNLGSEEFETIRIPFEEFKAYYRGAVVLDAPPLDLKKIGLFGFQTFGGVYDEFKQQGVGSLEIDIVAFYQKI